MLTKEDVLEALSKAKHPEIDYSLVDLGMIKDVQIDGETVTITLDLPFRGVPVKDMLVKSVKDAMAEEYPDARVEMAFSTMEDAVREEFASKARERWKS